MIKNKPKLERLIKIAIMVFLVFLPILFLGAGDDDVVISQVVVTPCNYDSVCDSGDGETYFTCPSDCDPVSSICNSNGICEPSLGETVSTCPSDCQISVVRGGGLHPEVIQEGLIGEPIEIFNIEVSTGIGATTISWETNKPTNFTLIFGYGRSGDEKVYLGELYTKKHSIRIDDLDFREEYFFKIFCEGIYGDNNFGYAELFIIRQSLPIQSSEEVDGQGQEGGETTGTSEELISSKTIDTATEELEHPITPPTDSVCEDDVCGFESFSQFWGDFKCTVKNSTWFSFVIEYLWQVLIFAGIIFFTFIIFKKKKDKENFLDKEK